MDCIRSYATLHGTSFNCRVMVDGKRITGEARKSAAEAQDDRDKLRREDDEIREQREEEEKRERDKLRTRRSVTS